MHLGRLFRPTNRRVRVFVGLLLAGLFCIQCTTTDSFRASNLVFAISAEDVATSGSQRVSRLETLARRDHIALLDSCLDHYRRHYRDYRCTFIKQERIRGILGREQWTEAKFSPDPFSVALKWTKNAPIGERVVYVAGKYGGHMLVRPKGILYKIIGTVKRKPESTEVMQNTLRPVTRFGLEKATESLRNVYVTARENGDLKESFGGYAEVAGRKALVLIRYLPENKDYPAYRTVTFVDLEYLIPVCIEGWDTQAQLICRYLYKDLEFNVGLTEADFLPQANGMKPPK